VKASDIDTDVLLALIRECNEARCDYSGLQAGWHGGRPGYGEDQEKEPRPHWANRFDLSNKLGVPDNVLLAKCRRLIRNGQLEGCACGCRGDFIVPGTPPSTEVIWARLLK
jgi:hypothetical protein